jgi:hypothetical protein
LVAVFAELSDLADPEPVFLASNKGAHLGELHGNDLAGGHLDLGLDEPFLRPGVFGKLVIGDAGDTMLLPHLFEERGRVALSVEDEDKSMTKRICLERLLGGLPGDIIEEPP